MLFEEIRTLPSCMVACDCSACTRAAAAEVAMTLKFLHRGRTGKSRSSGIAVTRGSAWRIGRLVPTFLGNLLISLTRTTSAFKPLQWVLACSLCCHELIVRPIYLLCSTEVNSLESGCKWSSSKIHDHSWDLLPLQLHKFLSVYLLLVICPGVPVDIRF